MRPIAVVPLLFPLVAGAEVVFQEHFEHGSNPFGFDLAHTAQSGASFEAGLADGGPQRGRVWAIDFRRGPGGYFGHRVTVRPQWALTDTLFWAGYVKFGDVDRHAEWRSAGDAEHRLGFPLIGADDDGQAAVIGRFLPWGEDGYRGRFVLVTADGREHPVMDRALVSNRWYLVQFALEDRGAADRVRIWINNADAERPNYDYVGGDMIDRAIWAPGARIEHGYRYGPGTEARFQYDGITIADSFIELPVPELPAPPAAPKGLRVE